MLEPDALIPVGRIVGTHGVRGMLKYHSYSGSIDTIREVGQVSLRTASGVVKASAVSTVSAHTGRFLLKLDGCDTADQAAELVGSELCLRRNQLPEPDDDEFYWCDLIGLQVETAEGEALGRIAEIFESGSSDIYVVRGGKREYLIPAIADVIKAIDLAGGRVVITPLDGLLDL